MKTFKVVVQYIEPKRSEYGHPVLLTKEIIVTVGAEKNINLYCEKEFGVGHYNIVSSEETTRVK